MHRYNHIFTGPEVMESELCAEVVTMRCVICKLGETHPGHVTVTPNHGEATAIFKGVPAEMCENCGEYYLSEQINGTLLATADDAIKYGTKVETLCYAA
jgi:YgiT-type zinc finger domain-containing protein